VLPSGLLLAAWGVKALGSEVKPIDPAAFAGVALVFAATAVGACYIPARRPTRTDPLGALRHE
jgi:ABC-type lipoprotein release transport system permease subunit